MNALTRTPDGAEHEATASSLWCGGPKHLPVSIARSGVSFPSRDWTATDDPDIAVDCNFLVYRTRLERDEDFFIGMHYDRLRHSHGEFKIAQRVIIIDQAVLAAKNINIFI